MRHALIRWLYRHGHQSWCFKLMKRNEAVRINDAGLMLARAVLPASVSSTGGDA